MSHSQAIERGPGAEREFDPLALLRIARRRYRLFLVAVLLVFGAVYWVALGLPSVYQATATILVQSQQIPANLAQSTVTAKADERIQIIQQRLMTRDNLLAIARKFSLFRDDPGRSPSDIVELMRRDTAIRRIDVGNRSAPDATAIGFTVSFKNVSPNAAASVANEFVTSILQQNLQTRTAQAAETSKFFDQQIGQLQKALAEQEGRIVDFKNQNQDALPDSFGSRQALLTQLQSQTGDLRSRITTLQSQRQLLVSQDGGALPSGSATETQLAQLRNQLVQLRALYSDSHPEVRAAVAKIDALDKAIALEEVRDASGTSTAAANAKASSGPNTGQIKNIDNQLDALNNQLAETERRSAALATSLQKTPQVDVALSVLMREYQTIQTQYSAAQAKAAQASTGEQLEQDQQAERFEVLEQATVPSMATEPDRPRIIIAGGFVAAVAAGAMVMLSEFLDQSIRRAGDLERKLNRRPLASIPYVTTAGERRRKRFRRIVLLFATMVVISAGLYVVQTYYFPLELLAQRVFDRLRF